MSKSKKRGSKIKKIKEFNAIIANGRAKQPFDYGGPLAVALIQKTLAFTSGEGIDLNIKNPTPHEKQMISAFMQDSQQYLRNDGTFSLAELVVKSSNI